MSQTANKSAISVLDEFCKKKLQPPAVYTFTSDIASEFLCTVEAFNETKIGKDKSKKKAKHAAARNLIGHLRSLESFKFDLVFLNVPENAEACTSTTVEKKRKATANTEPEINYVGKLLEYCVKNKLPPASFDMIDHTANAQRHLSEFSMKCRVNDVEKQGKGFNKKQAKQNAAMEVLSALTGGQCEPKNVSSSNEPTLKCLEKRKKIAPIEVLTVVTSELSELKDVSSSNEHLQNVKKPKRNAAMELVKALAARKSQTKVTSNSNEPPNKRFKSEEKPKETDTSSTTTEKIPPIVENEERVNQSYSFDHLIDSDYEEEQSGDDIDDYDCDEVETTEDYFSSVPWESDSQQGIDDDSDSDDI